jgi:hemerythrin superfamily protein
MKRRRKSPHPRSGLAERTRRHGAFLRGVPNSSISRGRPELHVRRAVHAATRRGAIAMPAAKQTEARKKSAPKKAPPKKTASAGKQTDAIALLKADHREVEAMFEAFEKARSQDRMANLAAKICLSLRVHTEIEEEIFYPAFLEATGESDMNDEAVIEHDVAKKLIAEIEEMSPGDAYYDAKVKVLSEIIKHHVEEEEEPGGMFAKARKSEMDLVALGAEMAARKAELMRQH